jgi:hypothetical protein
LRLRRAESTRCVAFFAAFPTCPDSPHALLQAGAPALAIQQPDGLDVLESRAKELGASSFTVVPEHPQVKDVKLGTLSALEFCDFLTHLSHEQVSPEPTKKPTLPSPSPSSSPSSPLPVFLQRSPPPPYPHHLLPTPLPPPTFRPCLPPSSLPTLFRRPSSLLLRTQGGLDGVRLRRMRRMRRCGGTSTELTRSRA